MEGNDSAWRHIDFLRHRVAFLENQHAVSVPAPMDWPRHTTDPPTPKPTFVMKAANPPKQTAVVIPLHQMTRRV
ncbi:hypothetical protein [Streptomyces johnsoniae]|uniref:Uncharacterized protein n=1 Tax=Streptomyces johnsoniae TaxID=3075532 RepID=A0ABU2S017_9ACTN|nr:hypothetical protein [Streptomyces sp. DSM 41886]MDT0442333.1 hypothetical protein [Streptomyces sp. DSM 41886]